MLASNNSIISVWVPPKADTETRAVCKQFVRQSQKMWEESGEIKQRMVCIDHKHELLLGATEAQSYEEPF